MPFIRLIVFLLLAVLYAAPLSAQYGYNIYDKNRNKKSGVKSGEEYDEELRRRMFEEYDYDYYSIDEELLRDSLDVREKVIADPEELRKLGASEEFIEELERLNYEMDSIATLKKDVLRSRAQEEGNDSISLDMIESLIGFQKELLVKKALSLPESQLYGHEFFRRNMLRLFEQEVDVNPGANYVIGFGDEIQVTVWGVDDFSEKFVVDKNGYIQPEQVGRIYLRGLEYGVAQEQIKSKFARVYDPNLNQIDVSLVYTRVIKVNLVGELFNPGTYEFPASNSVFNALVAIDGPNQLGSVRKLFIKRDGKTIRNLDVYEYLLDPTAETDFFLENNDYVFVPPVGTVVNLSGEVKREHNYELMEGEGLLDAIKYAGGLKPEAFTKTINVKRYSNNQEVLVDVNVDSLRLLKTDFPLLDGDSIFVYRVPMTLRNYVEVVGAVKVPGRYELRDGDQVSDILFKTEGILEDADMGRAYVIRRKDDQSKQILPFNLGKMIDNESSPENISLQNLDTIKVVSKRSFRQDFYVRVYGAVRQPGEYEFAEGLTLEDLLYISGGMKTEAANNRIEISRLVSYMDEKSGLKKNERVIVKRVEIGSDLSVNRNAEVYDIKPYDHVYIRTSPDFELQQNIKIAGEVLYPGDYALTSKEERISSVIDRAGGMTKYSFGEGARLYREVDSTGYVLVDLREALRKPQKSKYNYILTDGDSLYIPKHKDLILLKGAMGRFDVDSMVQVSAPYIPKKRARYYINRYGAGFSRFGKRKRTYVEQPNGKILKSRNFLVFNTFPRVQSGSTIFVDLTDRKKNEEERAMRRKDRNWNDAFDSFSSKIATILTILVLVQQARRD